MARRRQFNVFSLSFLDAITCGFGALILLYMIIVADINQQQADAVSTTTTEVNTAELKVIASRKHLVKLKQDLKDLLEKEAVLSGVRTKLASEIDATRDDSQALVASTKEQRNKVQQLQDELAELTKKIKKQSAKSVTPEEAGDRIRSVSGNGNRQYLTGLRMGGDHVVILVDCSTSMLDRTLVNVLLWRNRPEKAQRHAPKWVQTVNTIDWLTAQLKPGTQFQIMGFSDHVWPMIKGTEGKWLKVTDGSLLNEAVDTLRHTTPHGATSLSLAFAAVRQLHPKPDDIYLITDGLPTMGKVLPTRAGVTGRERLDIFERAVRELPLNVPVNVILLAMNGDPKAAPAFWKLALETGGSMLAPSNDWP